MMFSVWVCVCVCLCDYSILYLSWLFFKLKAFENEKSLEAVKDLLQQQEQILYWYYVDWLEEVDNVLRYDQ